MSRKPRFTRQLIEDYGPRPKYRYEFYATSKHSHGLAFPFRLLAAERCWPATEDDAQEILFTTMMPVKEKPLVSIRLVSYKEPNVDRWASFNWSLGTEKLG